jgi:signal transduction histidine kinase
MTNRLRNFRNLLLASVIVPVLMFGLFLWIDYLHVFHAAEKDVTSTSNIFEQHALNVFESHKLIAHNIDERVKGMSWESIARSNEVHDYLAGIKQQYPQVNSVWLADSSGTVRNGSEQLPATPVVISDRDYFHALQKADVGPFVGHIIKGRVIKRLLFNIASRRHNGSDSFDGVIIITADPDYFSNFWKIASTEDFSGLLIRDDGSVLARSSDIEPDLLTLPADSILMKMSRKGGGPYYAKTEADGGERIYAARKLAGYNVHILYGMSSAVAVNEWLQHVVTFGCIFILAMGALSAISTLALKYAVREQEALNNLNTLNAELEQRVHERTAELREKDRMLLQQNRLAAMGEMINNIAHQWRQPLNVVGLNIQALQMYYHAGKCDREFIDGKVKHCMEVIRHMSQTIDDFRNFFKPDREKTEFDVSQTIQQAIDLVADNLQRNSIEVRAEIDPDAALFGYANEFSQVILNILQNARDALVERRPFDRCIILRCTVEEGKTVITVGDNAGGIAEEIMEKIFEPYFSTKGVQGTGIGLYMSKNIIETNMGGTITANNIAQGAEFRIEFLECMTGRQEEETARYRRKTVAAAGGS